MAPFAGRVIARDLTKGEVVETTHKLFVVADLSTVWVLGNISEKDISYMQRATAVPNQPVEVYVPAYPDEVFQGTSRMSATSSIRLRGPWRFASSWIIPTVF